MAFHLACGDAVLPAAVTDCRGESTLREFTAMLARHKRGAENMRRQYPDKPPKTPCRRVT